MLSPMLKPTTDEIEEGIELRDTILQA